MDNIIATIVPIIVAALGGLTIIAYKHPRAYHRLWLILTGVSFLLLVAVLGWHMGSLTASGAGFSAALKLHKLDPVETTEILNAGNATDAPVWILFALIGMVAYLYFLWTFPFWLLDKESPRDKDQTK